MDFGSILNDHSQNAETRIQACFQLLKQKGEQAIDALIYGLFHDPNPIVRHECAYSLGELHSSKGSVALIHAIKTDSNPFVVHESALAVGNLGDRDARKVLEQLLESNDMDIVDTAEISLKRLEMKINGEYIEDLNIDPKELILDLNADKEYRIQASFSLLDDNSPESIQTLIQALKQETNPIVKHEIIFSLGETASVDAIKPLLDVLQNDTNAFVLHETLLSLATIGHFSAENTIRSYCDHPNSDVAYSAVIALDRLLS